MKLSIEAQRYETVKSLYLRTLVPLEWDYTLFIYYRFPIWYKPVVLTVRNLQ